MSNIINIDIDKLPNSSKKDKVIMELALLLQVIMELSSNNIDSHSTTYHSKTTGAATTKEATFIVRWLA
jgi:hypothetical protein